MTLIEIQQQSFPPYENIRKSFDQEKTQWISVDNFEQIEFLINFLYLIL